MANEDEIIQTREMLAALAHLQQNAPLQLLEIAKQRMKLDATETGIHNLLRDAPKRIEELEAKLKTLTDLEIEFPMSPPSPVARSRAKFENSLKVLCDIIKKLPVDSPMRKRLEIEIRLIADKLE